MTVGHDCGSKAEMIAKQILLGLDVDAMNVGTWVDEKGPVNALLHASLNGYNVTEEHITRIKNELGQDKLSK